MSDENKKLENSLNSAVEDVKNANTVEVPREKIEEGLRTYASDVAEMMKREKGSIIKIALAEQKRREDFQKRRDPTSTRNVVVMILGIAFIVGGIMIFISSILNRAKPLPITISSNSLPSFFFTENQTQIDVTDLNRTELINSIRMQVADETSLDGTIKNIFLSYKNVNQTLPLSSNVFLQKLGVEVPDYLFTNLQPVFMLGVYNKLGDNELFLIFQVKDFNEAFLGMRDWEKTMLGELVRLFGINTSGYGRQIFSREFTTETVLNKEARFLLDPQGQRLLSYVFLDKNNILITTEIDSLEEILNRINLKTLK